MPGRGPRGHDAGDGDIERELIARGQATAFLPKARARSVDAVDQAGLGDVVEQ